MKNQTTIKEDIASFAVVLKNLAFSLVIIFAGSALSAYIFTEIWNAHISQLFLQTGLGLVNFTFIQAISLFLIISLIKVSSIGVDWEKATSTPDEYKHFNMFYKLIILMTLRIFEFALTLS